MNGQLKGAAFRPVFTLRAWSATSVNRCPPPVQRTGPLIYLNSPLRLHILRCHDNHDIAYSATIAKTLCHHNGDNACVTDTTVQAAGFVAYCHSFFNRPCAITMKHIALLFARGIRYQFVQSLLLQCKLLDRLSKQTICPRFPSGRKPSIVLCLNSVGRVISASVSSQFNYSSVGMNGGLAPKGVWRNT